MLESKDNDEDDESKLLLAAGDWGVETLPPVQQAAASMSVTAGARETGEFGEEEGRTADSGGERLGIGEWLR